MLFLLACREPTKDTGSPEDVTATTTPGDSRGPDSDSARPGDSADSGDSGTPAATDLMHGDYLGEIGRAHV